MDRCCNSPSSQFVEAARPKSAVVIPNDRRGYEWFREDYGAKWSNSGREISKPSAKQVNTSRVGDV